MVKDKILVISKDEYELLKGLIPLIIKNDEIAIEKEKNPFKRKALKVSHDILNGFQEKLNKIKF